MFCRKCGKELSGNEIFCRQCGYKVSENSSQQNNPFYNAAIEEAKARSLIESQEKKKREAEKAVKNKAKGKVAIIIIALISVVLLIVGGIQIYRYIAANVEIKNKQEEADRKSKKEQKRQEKEYDETISKIYGTWIYDIDESDMLAIDPETLEVLETPDYKRCITFQEDGTYSEKIICEDYDEEYAKKYMAYYYLTTDLFYTLDYSENQDLKEFAKWREETYGSDCDYMLSYRDYNIDAYNELAMNLVNYNTCKYKSIGVGNVDEAMDELTYIMMMAQPPGNEFNYQWLMGEWIDVYEILAEDNMNATGEYAINDYTSEKLTIKVEEEREDNIALARIHNEIDTQILFLETFEFRVDENRLVAYETDDFSMVYKSQSEKSDSDGAESDYESDTDNNYDYDDTDELDDYTEETQFDSHSDYVSYVIGLYSDAFHNDSFPGYEGRLAYIEESYDNYLECGTTFSVIDIDSDGTPEFMIQEESALGCVVIFKYENGKIVKIMDRIHEMGYVNDYYDVFDSSGYYDGNGVVVLWGDLYNEDDDVEVSVYLYCAYVDGMFMPVYSKQDFNGETRYKDEITGEYKSETECKKLLEKYKTQDNYWDKESDYISITNYLDNLDV